jgi:molybdopterin-guanine dinucleotide biosynthesis protein A
MGRGNKDRRSMTVDPLEEAAGFVLAGGQSTRMGRDKALVEFNGQTLLARAIDTLKGAGLMVSIAGACPRARSQFEAYAAVVPDAAPGFGPLGGICPALRSTSARYGVFLSVDMPFLPASLITYMLRHARITGAAVTLASVNAFPQTFPVVILGKTLPVLERELAAERLGCYDAFCAAAEGAGEGISVLPVEILAQAGQVSHPDALPAVHWFRNVNTPADLESARSLHAGRVS